MRSRSAVGLDLLCPEPFWTCCTKSRQESESQAVFADVDWRVSDNLTLNFGGRYTKDDKETFQTGMVNATNEES